MSGDEKGSSVRLSLACDDYLLGKFHLDRISPVPRGVPQVEATFDIDAHRAVWSVGRRVLEAETFTVQLLPVARVLNWVKL